MLMRFDPFRELDRVNERVWNEAGRRQAVMPMDAYRHGNEFKVHFDVPGVDPGSVELTIEKNVLAVKAERRWVKEEGDEVVVSERQQGTFSRQLFLGEGLDAENIQASYDQGVLTVTIPVAEKAQPRKVEVSTSAGTGSQPAPIETTTSAA